jgi:hypothetical protein
MGRQVRLYWGRGGRQHPYLADRYAFLVITSNYKIEQCFPMEEDRLAIQ